MLVNDEETSRLFAEVDAIAAFLESASTQSMFSSSPAPSLPAATTGTGAHTLTLPRGTPVETVHTLVQLGHTLRERMHALGQHVDATLVAFYDHQRAKECKQLEEMTQRLRLVPEGFCVQRSSKEGDTTAADGVAAILRRLGDGRRRAGPSPPQTVAAGSCAAATHSPPPALSQRQGGYLNPTLSSTATARFPPLSTADAHQVVRATTTGDEFHVSSPIGPNPVLSSRARQTSTEQDIVSVLQAHLHLLLESALTQADGTCAAVYIHDSKSSSTAHAADNDVIASTTDARERSAKAVRAPRFLHCIAKLNTDGKLPDEISYASMNALVSVTSTGVAANMANMDSYFAADLSTRQGAPGRGAAAGGVGASSRSPLQPMRPAAESRNWAVKHLNVRNCVVVPLRRYGCLIIADKHPRVENQQANGCRFTMFDEHVAWATALLCDGLLQRYQRDLLLRHCWQPPAGLVSVLRPAALLNAIPVEAAEASRPSCRSGLPAHTADSSASGFSGKAAEVLAYMDGTRAETSNGGEESGVTADVVGSGASGTWTRKALSSMPTALTVVRTSDADYSNMAALFSSTQSGSPTRAMSKHGQAQQGALSEEDLFGSAAEYISRLETLWRDSLSTANAHEGVVAQHERLLERKDETIAALENKVQTLTMRLVHIEREHAAAAKSTVSSPRDAREPTKKKKSRA